jgi:hypothetical protein
VRFVSSDDPESELETRRELAQMRAFTRARLATGRTSSGREKFERVSGPAVNFARVRKRGCRQQHVQSEAAIERQKESSIK